MKTLALLLCTLLLTPLVAEAQEHVFTPDRRLRIEAPRVFDGRLDGIVRDFTHEGVHFEDGATGEGYRILPTEIRYLAEFRGEDRRYVMIRRARALGFVVGAVGAVAGPPIAIGLDSENLLAGAAVGAASGALVGTAAGLIWGSRHTGDVWREYRIIGHRRPRAAER